MQPILKSLPASPKQSKDVHAEPLHRLLHGLHEPTHKSVHHLPQEGEPCPKCGQLTSSARGIEVGQVFKLGTKYSEADNQSNRRL